MSESNDVAMSDKTNASDSIDSESHRAEKRNFRKTKMPTPQQLAAKNKVAKKQKLDKAFQETKKLLNSDTNRLYKKFATIVVDKNRNIKTLEDQVKSLNDKVLQFETDVDRLKAEISAQKSEIDAQKSEIGALKAEIGAQKSEIGSLKAEIGALKAHLDTETNKQNGVIQFLKKEIESLKRTGAACHGHHNQRIKTEIGTGNQKIEDNHKVLVENRQAVIKDQVPDEQEVLVETANEGNTDDITTIHESTVVSPTLLFCNGCKEERNQFLCFICVGNHLQKIRGEAIEMRKAAARTIKSIPNYRDN